MTDPLEALESLVEKHKVIVYCKLADELEPIIQQLLAERDELRRSRDAASALAASFRFSEREWRDKAQDKIAEVESLRAERERYRELVERFVSADIEVEYSEDAVALFADTRAALQASSPTIRADEAVGVFEGLAGAPVPVAKNSDTPEKDLDTLLGAMHEVRGQPSDTEEQR